MSRAEWILGALLIVLLIVVGAMGFLLWYQPGGGETAVSPTEQRVVVAAPTPVYEGQTALRASAAAQQSALGWQEDARLYQATATWPQGAGVADLLQGETAWNFTYYSPQNGETAVISVVENNASLLDTATAKSALNPLEITGWKIDSSEAARLVLGNGGEAFLRAEGISTLIMTLTTDNPSGRIEWFISLFSEETGNALTFRVDAASGEILEQIDSRS